MLHKRNPQLNKNGELIHHEPTIPAPVKLGPNTTRWRLADVLAAKGC